MSSTLLTALFSFVALHSSGILTGVIGTKLTGFIANHLKTDSEKKIYQDIMLPIIQALTGILQHVPASVAAAQAAVPATTASTTVTKTATITAAPLLGRCPQITTDSESPPSRRAFPVAKKFDTAPKSAIVPPSKRGV